jgi:2-polyprenyl-3-methyl-5-hydroxy-6-metoxy-1,4-benzoquinol methylase
MSTDPLSDAKIVDSWTRNAAPWTEAVRGNRIESRNLVTNDAIIDAVLSRSPRQILDIGCGEGWLVRALAEHGISGIGVDVVPALIDQAASAGGGDFRIASYHDIANGFLDVKVDALIANFSLIGKESVEDVIRRVPSLLNKDGALIIQTLHPLVTTGDQPYEDGWRHGSWAGFGPDFSDPAPWYFRTVETWKAMIAECGFASIAVREPLHPATGKPASIIFIAS